MRLSSPFARELDFITAAGCGDRRYARRRFGRAFGVTYGLNRLLLKLDPDRLAC
ncbi:MAG TPA: hypothetical protein VMW87_12685 [Spirochaetia bacterium]|nr:hypothetical protein [Spirochaetia bacterium]